MGFDMKSCLVECGVCDATVADTIIYAFVLLALAFAIAEETNETHSFLSVQRNLLHYINVFWVGTYAGYFASHMDVFYSTNMTADSKKQS